MEHDFTHSFGDNDLDHNYQRREICYLLLKIAQELAEQNRLKQIELKLKKIEIDISDVGINDGIQKRLEEIELD